MLVRDRLIDALTKDSKLGHNEMFALRGELYRLPLMALADRYRKATVSPTEPEGKDPYLMDKAA
jgi:hypothetical protein